MSVSTHWRDADVSPRCQHCSHLADERSFMCEDCASEADFEVQNLRDQLAGAVKALQAIYDRHHMAGDGSAGKVSGDALRALYVDPDAKCE